MLEKPIALELWEADELIQLANRNNLKFTIGYSQRSIRRSLSQEEDYRRTLGKVVSVLVSRHLSRELGKKIASRVRLSPVVMESTTISTSYSGCWSRQTIRVYSQGAYGYMKPVNGSHDVMSPRDMDKRRGDDRGGWNFRELSELLLDLIEITGTTAR